MAQNGTKYNLKPKQRKLAEALVNPECDKTVTDICKELKIPRRTYYNWLDNDDFKGYMKYLIDKYAESELAGVWRNLIAATEDKKVDAIKLYFEMTGLLPNKKENGDGEDSETGVVLLPEVKSKDE